MCGLIAVIERSGNQPELEGLTRAMFAISHRGPDGAALLRWGPVGLAHLRLAIVDQECGVQPIIDEIRGAAIICNGEIYNAPELRQTLQRLGHIFITGSDSEVALRAYEEWPNEFVHHLRGMFALAILDMRRERLVLARDRLGIKPLFVARTTRRFVYASEIKAIQAIGEIGYDADPKGIQDVLVYGYPIGSRTAFSGVNSVAPGSIVSVNLSNGPVRALRYWQSAQTLRRDDTNVCQIDEASERLGTALAEATKTHLMADPKVRCGCYVSGGIDSSALAILSVRAATQPKPDVGFSLTFQDARYDESSFAEKAAQAAGIRLIRIPEREFNFVDLERAMWSLECPQITTLDVSMQDLAQTTREAGCKFVLAGDGADELFGGYDHFGLAEMRRFAMGRVAEPYRAGVLKFSLEHFGYKGSFVTDFLSKFAKNDFAAHPITDLPWYPIWSLNAAAAHDLMNISNVDLLSGSIADTLEEENLLGPADASERAIAVEMATRLPNWILLRSDRNSMAHGIEVRVPFLDCKMIDVVTNIPCTYRSAPLARKFILSEALLSIVPQDIRARQKHAFNTPNSWVLNESSVEFNQLLSPESLRQVGLFRPKAVAELRQKVCSVYSTGQPLDLLGSILGQTLLGVVTAQLLFTTKPSVRAQPFAVATSRRVIFGKVAFISTFT
jgi:asparagine synthase (glutamine-hydrolysing)